MQAGGKEQIAHQRPAGSQARRCGRTVSLHHIDPLRPPLPAGAVQPLGGYRQGTIRPIFDNRVLQVTRPLHTGEQPTQDTELPCAILRTDADQPGQGEFLRAFLHWTAVHAENLALLFPMHGVQGAEGIPGKGAQTGIAELPGEAKAAVGVHAVGDDGGGFMSRHLDAVGKGGVRSPADSVPFQRPKRRHTLSSLSVSSICTAVVSGGQYTGAPFSSRRRAATSEPDTVMRRPR